jgi:GT2 family glycosyltransferase
MSTEPPTVSGRTERPDFSVVICTRNRARMLEACLARVVQMTYAGDWEIVLVDNDSTDETAALVERFVQRAPVPTAVVKKRRPGLGGARNAGLAVARGRLLAFTDDDCYPRVDWLTEARRAFDTYPDAGVIGGRILLFDPTDARYTIQEHNRLERLPPRSFVAPGFIQGANFVVARAVVERIGGFDTRLGAGTPFACEDTDFICRASFDGFDVIYDPTLVVWHHHGRKPGLAITHLERSYAAGRGAYYAKFLCRSHSRAVFARHLYWRWREPAYRRQLGHRLGEIGGAVRFGLATARYLGRDPYRLVAGDGRNKTFGLIGMPI